MKDSFYLSQNDNAPDERAFDDVGMPVKVPVQCSLVFASVESSRGEGVLSAIASYGACRLFLPAK
jgi:hypothetical protein